VYFTRRLSGTLDPQTSLWRIPVEGGDEEVVVESFRSSSFSRGPLLRRPGALLLGNELGRPLPALGSAPGDRGKSLTGMEPALGIEPRTC
jgi:hypothetical protein